jgi:GxxExxY protein
MMGKAEEIVFKDESYKVIGCCFEVYNQLGFGLREKNYQKALEAVLQNNNMTFDSQLYVPIKIGEKLVGKYYLDFIIDNKIALELKVGDHFLTKDIKQLYSYLKVKDLKLGIIVNFTSKGIKYKRILNLR